MDWLTFFTKLVEALIWPGLIVFIAIRFKTEFSRLLSSITKFKGPGFEWERQLNEAEKIADQTNLPAVPEQAAENATALPPDRRLKVVEDLVPTSPGPAILAMWKIVEEELANAFGTNTRSAYGFGLSFTVPDSLLELYNKLRIVRNEVAHCLHGATVDEARHFITLSRRLLAATDDLKHPQQEIADQQFQNSQELLHFIKEKSAAIKSAVIPRTTHLKFTKQGERTRVTKDVGMVLTMNSGGTNLIHVDDAEMVLNDGILHEMKIPISFMRDND